ncbi:MAG: L-rhamnose mutarotase [Spirochaetaceae bacterium]|nr:MAG: L-rhamnose mutarotase [Spirochaetaceae bacterium]
MNRVAFTMKLKAGYESEYKRRHDEIWPELVREIEAAGVQDYSIFLDPDSLTLFAVQKVKDHDTTADLPKSRVVKKWWKYMADIMDCNDDNSPVVRHLQEVFHMD